MKAYLRELVWLSLLGKMKVQQRFDIFCELVNHGLYHVVEDIVIRLVAIINHKILVCVCVCVRACVCVCVCV